MKQMAYETKEVDIANLLRDNKTITGFIRQGFKSHLCKYKRIKQTIKSIKGKNL